MDVAQVLLSVSATSVVYAKTMTIVKFVKKDLVMSIHSLRSTDLKMHQPLSLQEFMKMNNHINRLIANNKKLNNSHLLRKGIIIHSIEVVTEAEVAEVAVVVKIGKM